ncbi:PASTA domain-containing protein [Patulibacter medicamentivorans]|nr:PASTA domain-containing protein [Patulibacter medicamentivorans]
MIGMAVGGYAIRFVLLPEEQRTSLQHWSLIGITADQRGLRIDPGGWGGCDAGPPQARVVAETDDAVEVSSTRTERTIVNGEAAICPAIARHDGPVTLRLSRPLAGRRVVGRQRRRGFGGQGAGPNGRIHVPRVVGLSRDDAIDVLCGRGVRVATARQGEGVVVGQDPPAGGSLRATGNLPRSTPRRRLPCPILLTRARVTLLLGPR